MTRVAAVRSVQRTGGHRTHVNYVWTGRLTEFRFVAYCSTCGLLCDWPSENVAWAVAQDHAQLVDLPA